jgi:hypothetical protein
LPLLLDWLGWPVLFLGWPLLFLGWPLLDVPPLPGWQLMLS